MGLNRYSTAVHAWTLMKDMKPGECFNIPGDTLDDMRVPLDDPRDRPDRRYKLDKLQHWLDFETEVRHDTLSDKFIFERRQ